MELNLILLKVQLTGFAIKDDFEMTRKLLHKKKSSPQAIFTSAMTLLKGMLKYNKDPEPRALKQLRIVSYNGHPVLDNVQGLLYPVRQNAEKIIRKPFEIIHGVLLGWFANGSDFDPS